MLHDQIARFALGVSDAQRRDLVVAGERHALDTQDSRLGAKRQLRVRDHDLERGAEFVGGFYVAQRGSEDFGQPNEHLSKAVDDRRRDEVLAVLEVAVQQRDGNVGLERDALHAELRQAVALNFVRGGFKNPVPCHVWTIVLGARVG